MTDQRNGQPARLFLCSILIADSILPLSADTIIGREKDKPKTHTARCAAYHEKIVHPIILYDIVIFPVHPITHLRENESLENIAMGRCESS